MVTSNILLPIFTLLVLLSVFYGVSAFNITEILDSNPSLSDFNSYLTRTKLADTINAQGTVTVLAVSNSAMSAISGNSTAAIKNILALHVLLDFYDDIKLHNLKVGDNTTATTLYQTTGVAQDRTGEVNITVGKGGDVRFTSAQPGSKPGPEFVKEINHIGFHISVLEISDLIIVKSLLTSGPPDVNITAVVEGGGCKTFASLISNSGVVKTYMKQMSSDGGITIFAPKDEAFKAKGVPDFANVSNADLVSILLFHALNNYAPINTLKSAKGELKTLAPPGNYGLTATAVGSVVTLHTGVDDSKIVGTLKDEFPVVIYAVDTVLLPEELFGNSTSPVPAPVPGTDSPTPSPKVKPPSPVQTPDASPPAPPADEGGNGGDSGGSDDNSPSAGDDENPKNGAVHGNVALLTVVVSAVSVIISFVM
ncbi:hypothetical protein RND81_03G200700 [Saponaria officinalis]|uniref:FAS1 domain-containing protein n=1 Tax=Saponaria officinalis TaxID=3572 RepID=A0AAW1M1K9_SAPOF